MNDNTAPYRALIRARHPISAIKLYRFTHKCGLAEAKRAIDPIRAEEAAKMASGSPTARMREAAAQVAQELFRVSLNGHQLAAAIRALPDEDEWQPIETAPRDGTEILIGKWKERGGFRFCRSSWEHFPGNSMEGEQSYDWWACDDDHNDITEDEGPTHWRPLPAPPKGGE